MGTRPLRDRGDVGRAGEDLAVAHLTELGHEVLARNWRPADTSIRGELDIVTRSGDALVFVEVKTRRSNRFGGPLAAVTEPKRRAIRSLALAFVTETRTRSRHLRFDVIGIVLERGSPQLTHLERAF